jgi:hypothetical protein
MTESAVSPALVTKISGEAHFAYGIFGYDPPIDDEQAKRLKRQFAANLGFYGSYRMAIGDMEFQLSRDEFNALGKGKGYYNVYYVPTIRKIVSVERLALDPTQPRVQVPKPMEAIDPSMDNFGDDELRA